MSISPIDSTLRPHSSDLSPPPEHPILALKSIAEKAERE